jgi:hypothetical protein
MHLSPKRKRKSKDKMDKLESGKSQEEIAKEKTNEEETDEEETDKREKIIHFESQLDCYLSSKIEEKKNRNEIISKIIEKYRVNMN